MPGLQDMLLSFFFSFFSASLSFCSEWVLHLRIPLHSAHYEFQHFYCPRKSLSLRSCTVSLFYTALQMPFLDSEHTLSILSFWANCSLSWLEIGSGRDGCFPAGALTVSILLLYLRFLLPRILLSKMLLLDLVLIL